ncbi:MAG: hypothetical protein LBJ00_07565 [Planctomycetaceae bacterium]|jgi:hypothetical protein|nr:hypothetical protein [Planctomycetaceae bacterium]
MDNYQLSSRQVASLKALHRTLRDRKEADRVKAVMSPGSGWSISTVAEILMLDANTVRSYFDKYVHGGEEELREFNYVGRQPMLTAKQEKALSRHLDANVYLSSSEIRHYIPEILYIYWRYFKIPEATVNLQRRALGKRNNVKRLFKGEALPATV